MIQKNNKIAYIYFYLCWRGQDKPAWTACPPEVKITRVGGKISRDSLPPGGQAVRGGKINCYTGTTCADPGIFLSGGGGGGSRLLNFFYSLQRGSNGFITHFPGGGESNYFQGGPNANFYRITITCVFPGGGGGGSGPPIPL